MSEGNRGQPPAPEGEHPSEMRFAVISMNFTGQRGRISQRALRFFLASDIGHPTSGRRGWRPRKSGVMMSTKFHSQDTIRRSLLPIESIPGYRMICPGRFFMVKNLGEVMRYSKLSCMCRMPE